MSNRLATASLSCTAFQTFAFATFNASGCSRPSSLKADCWLGLNRVWRVWRVWRVAWVAEVLGARSWNSSYLQRQIEFPLHLERQNCSMDDCQILSFHFLRGKFQAQPPIASKCCAYQHGTTSLNIQSVCQSMVRKRLLEHWKLLESFQKLGQARHAVDLGTATSCTRPPSRFWYQ